MNNVYCLELECLIEYKSESVIHSSHFSKKALSKPSFMDLFQFIVSPNMPKHHEKTLFNSSCLICHLTWSKKWIYVLLIMWGVHQNHTAVKGKETIKKERKKLSSDLSFKAEIQQRTRLRIICNIVT